VLPQTISKKFSLRVISRTVAAMSLDYGRGWKNLPAERISRIRASAVLLAVSMLSISCAPERPVTLAKEPLTVETVYFDPKGDLAKVPLENDEGAVTVWRFGCKTDFDFDIVEKTFLSKNDHMVTIRVKGCRISLTAPVTVYLPEKADKNLVAHENGHVEICRRIYNRADKQALIAASQSIGKQYQASGRTVEAACQQAIEDASASIYQVYHDKASMAVNRISEIYDELDRTERAPADKLVERAFARHMDERLE